jgi:hypothetical protein
MNFVENRTRVMRVPTRGLAEALRGIYTGVAGGGRFSPPARGIDHPRIRPASQRIYQTQGNKTQDTNTKGGL